MKIVAGYAGKQNYSLRKVRFIGLHMSIMRTRID